MAKVRIQAHSADAEEALELNELVPAFHKSHDKQGKHPWGSRNSFPCLEAGRFHRLISG